MLCHATALTGIQGSLTVNCTFRRFAGWHPSHLRALQLSRPCHLKVKYIALLHRVDFTRITSPIATACAGLSSHVYALNDSDKEYVCIFRSHNSLSQVVSALAHRGPSLGSTGQSPSRGQADHPRCVRLYNHASAPVYVGAFLDNTMALRLHAWSYVALLKPDSTTPPSRKRVDKEKTKQTFHISLTIELSTIRVEAATKTQWLSHRNKTRTDKLRQESKDLSNFTRSAKTVVIAYCSNKSEKEKIRSPFRSPEEHR